MQLLKVLALTPLFSMSLLASPTPSSSSVAPTSSATAKPGLAKLFTASLQLGKALKPINIPSGSRLVEPISNGTITGPGLNATVEGGTAFPIFYDGMTFERPDIIVFGNTDKNGSFFATLKGVGSPVDQYVAIEIEVGPPYASLNESFILGEILHGSNGTSVTVDAYLVGKAAK